MYATRTNGHKGQDDCDTVINFFEYPSKAGKLERKTHCIIC